MGNKGCSVIKKIIKQVFENVIERAFGELNNVFQYQFNKILSYE